MTYPVSDYGGSSTGGVLERVQWPAYDSLDASAAGQIVSGHAVLGGFSFTESSGAAPATIELFDGFTTGSQRLFRRTLDPGQSFSDWPSGPGVHCRRGIFLNVIAGTIVGTVYVALL
jgi:hypothetical protein